VDEEPSTDDERRVSNGDEEPSVKQSLPTYKEKSKKERKKERDIYLFIYLFTYLCSLGLTKHPFGNPPLISHLWINPLGNPINN
jgi:hypothetical protein